MIRIFIIAVSVTAALVVRYFGVRLDSQAGPSLRAPRSGLLMPT